ncbi:MAG: D-alanine--D-alanine ligase family protein [Leadbetterella sp.]
MQQKLRVGILFGGQSREREISFLGGKTAFENLDKRLFEPVPLFVDSLGNIIKIMPELMYEKEIRDFYPSRNQNKGYDIYIESLGELKESQLYKIIHRVGSHVKLEELKNHIDFAFNVMHGPFAEDGNLQGLMEWLQIPYMGPGILASGIGIHKPFQNHLISLSTGQVKRYFTISKKEWKNSDSSELLSKTIDKVGFPFVVKAPHQGSSIGVAIIKKRSTEEFQKAMFQCFFETRITAKEWNSITYRQKKSIMQRMVNLDEGIGLPVACEGDIIYHPAELLTFLDNKLKIKQEVVLAALHGEDEVLIEEFIKGQEFSCGVIQNDEGKCFALPPTEVYGDIQTFDFKSKYKSNVSKKRIPVQTSDKNLNAIHEKILTAFESTSMAVVARIDGFLTKDDTVLLHDPNTIPGMSPASFIFKQMAEIGFSITHTITYFIRQSIRERIRSGKGTIHFQNLLNRLDANIEKSKNTAKEKLALVFGENDEEFAKAKLIYGKYIASEEFEPYPICAARNGNKYVIPINLMFKPDILEFGAAVGQPKHPFIQKAIDSTEELRVKYVGDVDFSLKKITEEEFQSQFTKITYCSKI